MICNECRSAGQWNRKALDEGRPALFVGAEEWHAMCHTKGCFCQHKTGELVQRAWLDRNTAR